MPSRTHPPKTPFVRGDVELSEKEDNIKFEQPLSGGLGLWGNPVIEFAVK